MNFKRLSAGSFALALALGNAAPAFAQEPEPVEVTEQAPAVEEAPAVIDVTPETDPVVDPAAKTPASDETPADETPADGEEKPADETPTDEAPAEGEEKTAAGTDVEAPAIDNTEKIEKLIEDNSLFENACNCFCQLKTGPVA